MHELTFDKDRGIPVIKIYRQMRNLLPTHQNPPHKITGIGIPPVTPDSPRNRRHLPPISLQVETSR